MLKTHEVTPGSELEKIHTEKGFLPTVEAVEKYKMFRRSNFFSEFISSAAYNVDNCTLIQALHDRQLRAGDHSELG